MKAISLWQPYATFMAHELKLNETRSRLTHWRGELAICSAQRTFYPCEFGHEVEDLVDRLGHIWMKENKLKPRGQRELFLPKGYVVCVVNVVACKPTEEVNPSPLELVLGDYRPGRFAWITRECRKLKTPVPVKGKQGFFNLPTDVEAEVRAQL